MKPSEKLINDLLKLEKEMSRAKRHLGLIYSKETLSKLDKLIGDYKRAISILSASKL